MKMLDRKLMRDVVRSRGALVSILLVIVLGIACFVGLASSYVNLSRAQREYYAQCRMADFSIELKKAPESEVERIARIPGVLEMRPRLVFEATVDLDDVIKPLNSRIISMPSDFAPVINNVVMRRGSYFTDDQLQQVIVNDTFARERNINPGQIIHVILNNRRQKLSVVGTAISSEFVYLIGPGELVPDPANFGVLYIKQEFAEEVLDFDGACNQVLGLLDESIRDRPEAILDDLDRMLDDYGVFATVPRSQQPSHRILRDEIRGLRISGVIIPVIFLGIAALILNILMMRLIEQQRVTIGTLKALGVANGRIILHFLKFGLIVGLIGGLIGCVVGFMFAEGMTSVYHQFFEFPRLENQITMSVMITAIVLSCSMSLLGVWRGVNTVAHLKPAEAMRLKPPMKGGTIGLERFRKFWASIGFRWQLVCRNVIRQKRRTAVGVLAAALGCALILTSFSLLGSVEELIQFQFDKVLISDIDLVLKDDRDVGSLFEAKNLPGVDHAEPLFIVACTMRHGYREKRMGITGVIQGATMTVPRRADGEPVRIPEIGLVVSRKLADILMVKPGQSVILEPVRGRREPLVTTISSINDDYLGLAAYADYDYLNRLVGEIEAVSSIQLRTSHDLLQRAAMYRELKTIPGVQAVNDIRESKANLVATLQESMNVSLVSLVTFAGAIYFGSILTTSFVSIAERKREIATLLVVGYTRVQVGAIMLRESMIVNVMGGLLGLPLGYVMTLLLVQVYDTEMYRFPLNPSIGIFAIAFVFAIVFTLCAHVFVQRAVNRLDWLEALNVKE